MAVPAVSPPTTMGPGGTPVPGVAFVPLSWDSLRPLLLPQRPPCLSVALPTHRRVPDNRVDVPRYRHLVAALRERLAAAHPAAEVARWLEPLEALGAERRFWKHTHDGLVVLAADGTATALVLDEPVAALARVGETFHVADLLRLRAAGGAWRVLALTSRTARLFVLGATALEPIPFPAAVAPGAEAGTISRDDVIDRETFQPHRVRRALGSAGTLHGGAGSTRDATRADTERFFRAVAEAAEEPGGPPTVLVALPELAALYREVAGDERLLPEGVPLDPHALDVDDVRDAVRPVVARRRARDIDEALDRFRSARAHGRGTTDVAQIARAAVAGNVWILLVEAERRIPGILDRATGDVAFTSPRPGDPSLTGSEPATTDDDLVGAIGAAVVLHGGTLLAVDRLAMPDDTGLAAIERHPEG